MRWYSDKEHGITRDTKLSLFSWSTVQFEKFITCYEYSITFTPNSREDTAAECFLMGFFTLKSLDLELKQNVLEIGLDQSNLTPHRATLPGKVPNGLKNMGSCVYQPLFARKCRNSDKIVCTTIKETCFIGGNTMTKWHCKEGRQTWVMVTAQIVGEVLAKNVAGGKNSFSSLWPLSFRNSCWNRTAIEVAQFTSLATR